MGDELVSQWVDVVAKLTALTQQGKLLWTATMTPGKGGASFIAKYKDKTLRLSRVHITELLSFGENRETTRLEFIDNLGNGLWSFPDTANLDDLFNAAKFQAAGVQSFLTDILKE